MSQRRCLAATIGLMFVAGNLVAQPAPEPDPLYYVEIIVFQNLSASRFEEDFFHDSDDLPGEPGISLLRLPNIELESTFEIETEAPEPVTAVFDSVADTETLVPVPDLTGAITDESQDIPGSDPFASVEPADALTLFEVDEPSPGTARNDAGFAAVPGFRILTPDELELGSWAASLGRAVDYRVLAHVGWAQPGVEPARAPDIALSRLGITNPSGTIQINRQRFLQATFDLELREGAGTFWRLDRQFGLGRFEYAPSYRHEYIRYAIRSGFPAHHIDHPLFGVMMLITPAPEPEDEELIESDTDGPAA